MKPQIALHKINDWKEGSTIVDSTINLSFSDIRLIGDLLAERMKDKLPPGTKICFIKIPLSFEAGLVG